MKRYWLFKSEPTCFSIQDLSMQPNQTARWDGIRNYQVRNILRDDVQMGDALFFYHSSAKPSGIVGTAEIVKTAYPDCTAWEPQSEHFDPACSPDKPRWLMVDVRLTQIFKRLIRLEELKAHPLLQNMPVTQRGNRLSITPVTAEQWQVILTLQ